jgi:hypothetical protein
MSYELIKIQSQEGYAYNPSQNKLINFVYNEPSIIDMEKSYVIFNTTLNVNANATVQTAANAAQGNLKMILNPALAPLGFAGTVQYPPVAMVRNAKISSESVKDFYIESRDCNILSINKGLYTKDVSDHQRDALTGGGWSRGDSLTQFERNSQFLNKSLTDESTYTSPDCIIPLKDLYGEDLGKSNLFPSGLMGNTRLELELEDRFNLVDVCHLPEPISITYAAADRPRITDATANLLTFNFNSNAAGVSNSVLVNGNNLLEPEFYVGMPLKVVLSDDASPVVNTTNFVIVTEINYNADVTETDAFNIQNTPNTLQLTINKTWGSLFGKVAGTDKVLSKIQFVPMLASEMLATDATNKVLPVTYTVNRAELVLARRRLSPQLVQQYYSAMLREGMTLGVWDTIPWNINSSSDVSEFWKLPSFSYAVMNIKPSVGMLYNLVDGLTAYRWTYNDVESTNRDVVVSNTNTSSLYKHKILSTLGACNLKVKSVQNNLNKALTGSEGAQYVAYPLDIVPYTQDSVLLKLNMKSSTANMPAPSSSYLFVKHDKNIRF